MGNNQACHCEACKNNNACIILSYFYMEITDAKYQELITDQAKAKTLEAENAKLIAAAENTKIALKEGRENAAELKAKVDEVTAALEAEKVAKAEVEKKALEADTLKADADKWKAHETAALEARKAGIDEMKTKLGEEFMTKNAAFLDGLSDEKVEIYLKNHVESLSGGKQTIAVGTGEK